jgi:hypothetical protein
MAVSVAQPTNRLDLRVKLCHDMDGVAGTVLLGGSEYCAARDKGHSVVIMTASGYYRIEDRDYTLTNPWPAIQIIHDVIADEYCAPPLKQLAYFHCRKGQVIQCDRPLEDANRGGWYCYAWFKDDAGHQYRLSSEFFILAEPVPFGGMEVPIISVDEAQHIAQVSVTEDIARLRRRARKKLKKAYAALDDFYDALICASPESPDLDLATSINEALAGIQDYIDYLKNPD